GTRLQRSGDLIDISVEIPVGHRFALRDIPAKNHVRQYGQPIGTSLGIKQGDLISHANMSDEVPVIREVPADLHNPGPDYLPSFKRASFMGFRRPDERIGTRNFLLIIPTSMCASHESQQLSTLAEWTLWSRDKFPNVDGG